MESVKKVFSIEKMRKFPLLFGFLGALIGLVLRYAYTGEISNFPFKNVLHSHSHVMLLGFLFNALLLFVWANFTKGVDKISYTIYIAMQLCVAILLVVFMVQGYAFYSILFSTLHLWLSYVLLIRLWKKIEPKKGFHQLVKLGVVFHFLSSLGPYMLGPLMVFEMQESSWYQQAIFFYLHFQYFGVFYVWMLALLLQKTTAIITRKQRLLIAVSLLLLFAHSLDYSFDHWSIQVLGGLGSLLLFIVLLSFKDAFKNVQQSYKNMYYIILFIGLINIAGTIPSIANLVVESRFMLIAWLHLLFLGMYIPFLWINVVQRMKPSLWYIYGFTVLFSEAILIFPAQLSQWLSISVMWLLFIAYLGVFLCISYVHLTLLFDRKEKLQQ